jgi:hypothetical protein
MNAISKEAIRQQRETFDQQKEQARQWFKLQVRIVYCAIVLLLGVLAVCTLILFNGPSYPEFVVRAATVALFADIVGLLAAVWRFALRPNAVFRLRPVTGSREASDSDRSVS